MKLYFKRANRFGGKFIELRGDCSEARASAHPASPQELANWGEVVVYKEPALLNEAFLSDPVPGHPIAGFTCEDYGQRWFFDLDFAVVSRVGRVYNLRMFNKYASSTDDGFSAARQARIQQLLESWKATGIVFAANEVTCTIDIGDAMSSVGFWDGDLNPDTILQTVFTVEDYNEATGIIHLKADYSATGKNPTSTERFINKLKDLNGFELLSHANRIIEFTLHRSVARDRFAEDIRIQTEDVIYLRRWFVGEGVMNAIETNGGSMNVYIGDLVTYLKDHAAV